MKISKINESEAPLDLLLLADPSKSKISKYLSSGIVFEGRIDDQTVSAAVIEEKEKIFEIKNIVVDPNHQRKGFGKIMLSHLLQYAKKSGGNEVFLGTGNSSLSQLNFYQKMGFRITKVLPDYFADYDPPIIENGIRCIDMIILTYKIRQANKTLGQITGTSRQ